MRCCLLDDGMLPPSSGGIGIEMDGGRRERRMRRRQLIKQLGVARQPSEPGRRTDTYLPHVASPRGGDKDAWWQTRSMLPSGVSPKASARIICIIWIGSHCRGRLNEVSEGDAKDGSRGR